MLVIEVLIALSYIDKMGRDAWERHSPCVDQVVLSLSKGVVTSAMPFSEVCQI